VGYQVVDLLDRKGIDLSQRKGYAAFRIFSIPKISDFPFSVVHAFKIVMNSHHQK
jgi:hypothetical protein